MRLFNDDCLKIMADLPDESIDLVVTDCPYHIVSGRLRQKKPDLHFKISLFGTRETRCRIDIILILTS